MELIMFLYIFFTGCIYASWLWDAEDSFWIKLLNILWTLALGWLLIPIFIGRILKKFYKDL